MTALIVHPTADFNTFTDIAGADALSTDYLNHELWDALDVTDKQRWLLLTGSIITALDSFEAPELISTCLPKAQMMIVMHHLKYGLQESTYGKQGQLKARKFDVLYREYYKHSSADRQVEDDIPAEARPCLEQYKVSGCTYVWGVGVTRRKR